MKLASWIKQNQGVFRPDDLQFIIQQIFPRGHAPEAVGDQSCLDDTQLAYLGSVKDSYRQGIPLAYILKKEEFWGLEFCVDSSVLVPRPDTERIVEKTIEIIREKGCRDILDLCCGSGNIAVSMEKSLSLKLRMVACDISFAALRIAAKNIRRHRCEVDLVQSDMFSAFQPGSFDLIVSNPPYVDPSYISAVQYEPYAGLAAGNDGLDFLFTIVDQAHRYIRRGGFLILEMGFYHRRALESCVRARRRYYRIKEWIKDYGNNWRGVVIQVK